VSAVPLSGVFTRPRHPLRRLLVVAVLAGGCAAPVGTESLDLGTGEWQFEAVETGQPVPIIHGIQGGYHVWVSMRAEGLATGPCRLELETEPVEGGRPVEQSHVNARLAPGPGGGEELIGWPAVLAHPGCDVGRALTIRAALHDTVGVVARGEMIVVPEGTGLPACSLP
jgi:hypothetical protein